jgi:hypothetical protein
MLSSHLRASGSVPIDFVVNVATLGLLRVWFCSATHSSTIALYLSITASPSLRCALALTRHHAVSDPRCLHFWSCIWLLHRVTRLNQAWETGETININSFSSIVMSTLLLKSRPPCSKHGKTKNVWIILKHNLISTKYHKQIIFAWRPVRIYFRGSSASVARNWNRRYSETTLSSLSTERALGMWRPLLSGFIRVYH